MYCDNQSVVTNSSIPTSMLNKRHNAICYHRVREAQAAGTIMVGWIMGEYNLADLFTKTTMTGDLKYRLVHNIFNNDAALPPGVAWKPGSGNSDSQIHNNAGMNLRGLDEYNCGSFV